MNLLHTLHRAALSLACALGTGLLTTASAAPVTYHYEASPWSYWIDNSGHNFQTFANPIRSASLDFTVAGPLAANLGSQYNPVNVTGLLSAWSYDGGRDFTQVNSLNASAYFSLFLRTGSQGEILESRFYIGSAPLTVPGLPSAAHASLYVDYSGSYLQERVDYSDYIRCQGYNLYGQPYCYAGSEGGYNQMGGGLWTMSAVNTDPQGPGNPVPEPASLALVSAAALGLACTRRRKLT
ncbi:PEP-CTERM sorting domain-containing protein [Roseateles sp.]|uniref:PEP-CTERM sorting domain-containing protein n=1 Tax=Roseateles sp. TaxID=1971397 RepID=UPI00393DBB18